MAAGFPEFFCRLLCKYFDTCHTFVGWTSDIVRSSRVQGGGGWVAAQPVDYAAQTSAQSGSGSYDCIDHVVYASKCREQATKDAHFAGQSACEPITLQALALLPVSRCRRQAAGVVVSAYLEA